MKFHTTICKGLVLAGFAAFALLPASIKAQEITNTQFDDGPNVTTLAQPMSTQPASASMTFALPAQEAMLATQAISSSATNPQQAIVLEMPSVSTDEWIITSLLACAALIGLYAIAELRRANRDLTTARSTYVSTRIA
jgi:hypothetical protein